MNQQDKKRAAAPGAKPAEAGAPETVKETAAPETAGGANPAEAAPETAKENAAPAGEKQPAEQPAEQPENQPEERPAADEPAGGEAALPALKEQLATAQKEAAEAKDRLLRTAAEYDNFRKRSAREQDAAFNNGVSFAVGQILNILDTLEMAAHAETSDENYKKGVVMTLDKAAAALSALKVEEIPAEGQPFDPNLHAAVGQAPATDEAPSGHIVQVYQKGYRLGDKVIRHAAVVVAE